jgi:release factor glutamine methyltransferase
MAEATEALGDPQEARWILLHAGGLQASELLRCLDEAAPPTVPARVRALVERRRSGEPLQWVMGAWGFRGLEVAVDGRALVPRPETETVVEQALVQLARVGPPPRVVDLGTGSGVIALSIASECRRAVVLATDRSPQALELAGENLARQPDEVRRRVTLAEGDWFEAVPDELTGDIAVIVSNPPYLAADEWGKLEAVVREYDPYEALVAGASGLEAISRLVAEAPAWLRPGGALVVEIAPHQASAALDLMTARGAYGWAEVVADLAGRPRVLVGRSTA